MVPFSYSCMLRWQENRKGVALLLFLLPLHLSVSSILSHCRAYIKRNTMVDGYEIIQFLSRIC
jgi:hypothetical protein